MSTLIVPGLGNSGPDHWQSWWQAQDAEAVRVDQAAWDFPNLPQWCESVGLAIQRARRPVWIVAHSFGCLATARVAASFPGQVAGALLVAPADPDRFRVAHLLPERFFPFPSIVVASSNDPWMGLLKAAYWAERWGSRLVSLGPVGHINEASGFGPWPDGMRLFDEMVAACDGTPDGEIMAAEPPIRSAFRSR